MNKKAKLTQEQKRRIREAVCSRCCSDDTDPQEVIAKNYKGDEDKYLLAMAKWHNISLD